MGKNIKDFTKGNITVQLWGVAWPMMLTIFFYTLYNIVDAFWVGKISSDAIAAVGVSQTILMVMMSLSMGISVGSSVVTSMNIGAGNKKEASRVMAQSFILATFFGIIFTAISLLFKESILAASGAMGGIYEPALGYFTIVSAGSLLLFYLINVMMAFNAEGDTFMATKLFAVSTAVNVVLDPILIFGKFGFPALGIEGAAYATLISQGVFIAIAMYILSSKKRSVRFQLKNLSVRKESVKQVFDIGIPAALTQAILPVGLAILTYMVSQVFLEAGVTSFTLVYRLEFFAYLPAIGFSMAAMSLIGQNMGAKNFQRANEVFKKACSLSFSAAIILGVLLILGGKYIIALFTSDPVVTGYAMSYLWIVAGTYGFLSISMVVSSTFQAMGKSWNGFWLLFMKMFIITLPLTYICIFIYSLPIWSVWASLALGSVILAVVGYIWNRMMFNKILSK